MIELGIDGFRARQRLEHGLERFTGMQWMRPRIETECDRMIIKTRDGLGSLIEAGLRVAIGIRRQLIADF